MTNIKVLSWNIWIHGNLEGIKELIEKANADIVALQEVKTDDPELEIIPFMENLGYDYVFSPIRHSWNGNSHVFGPAIFSKHQITSKEILSLSSKDDRPVAVADILIDGKTIRAVSAHLIHTHQNPSEIQATQAENLLKAMPAERAILMGDFNATPQSETIQKISKVLQNTDLKDQPTWSTDQKGCQVCLIDEVNTKLDYIFITPDIELKHFEIKNSLASDHLPVMAELEIQPH